MSKLVVLIAALLYISSLLVDAQTTEGCESEYGCFLPPLGCADTVTGDASACSFVYKYKTNPNDSSLIDFVLQTKAANPDSAYVAIGFAYSDKMANSSLVICKFSTALSQSTVEHYYAEKAARPAVIDPNFRELGITNVAIEIVDSLMTCKFSRSKSANQTYSSKFFDIGLKNTIHILAAKGAMNDQGEPAYHQTNKFGSSAPVDFESTATTEGDFNLSLAKAHGSLMVIAWVLFASVGICLPRYMKLLFPKRKFFQLEFWFVAHRILMVSVVLFSIAGLLLILAFDNWKWVSTIKKKEFAHSILGIITIGLAVLQVIGGSLRPAKDAPNRNSFNWGHRISGITTFILSVVTISLAFSFVLPGHSWTIVLIWVVWIVVVPTVFEILDARLKKPNGNAFASRDMKLESDVSGNDKIHTTKAVFFFIHFIVQVAIAAVFVVRIVIIKVQ